MTINALVRPNIRSLKPYSSARSEFTGDASVFLDANESPFENGYNRYPDPLQRELKQQIALLKQVSSDQIFLGNGSDEAIDLIYRIFCVPQQDNVVAPDPTYGMYQVCAEINDVEYRPVKLAPGFLLDAKVILDATDAHTKAIFLCSPNNPTGNLFAQDQIEKILDTFKGIVIIDEAYIDFASRGSMTAYLERYPRLIVLQTFSKAWGQASIRLGMAFASSEIIGYFNKVKYPYNINVLTQRHAIEMLREKSLVKEQSCRILAERERLQKELQNIAVVECIYPTEANFLLVAVQNPDQIYKYLTEQGVIVRNRNKISLCQGCLRITIGTEAENTQLLKALANL
ncbi:MAG: histidinol-phosphate transaminase [Bacteroidales bacterium]